MSKELSRLEIAKQIEQDAAVFYKQYTAGLKILDDDLRLLLGFGVFLHNKSAADFATDKGDKNDEN
jgi:hypothetical protein